MTKDMETYITMANGDKLRVEYEMNRNCSGEVTHTLRRNGFKLESNDLSKLIREAQERFQ